MPNLMSLLAEVDPTASGQITGKVIVVLGAAAGAMKCYAISRRPTTNARCALSLMFLLLAWFSSGTIGMLQQPLGLPSWCAGITGIVSVGLAVAAIVLAILGLVEYARPGHAYEQGRAQAIWALLLSLFFITAFTVGIARAGNDSSIRAPVQAAAGQTLKFEELNFQFNVPGKPWVQMDAPKLNRAAKLGFMRARPNIYCIIIAEEIGTGLLQNEALVEVATTQMRSAADSAQISRPEKSRVGRLDGLRWDSEVRIRQLNLAYQHWVCATNGWAYQLICWGAKAEKSSVDAEAQRLAGRFSLLDYGRRASASGATPKSDFVSTNFQFTMRWAGSDWRPWAALETELPAATFGALHADDGALMVTAVALQDLQPHPEAIYTSFGGLLGARLNEGQAEGRRPITSGPFSGIETQVKVISAKNEEFSYRLRVLHGGGVAYLAAAWVQSSHPRRDEVLTDGLERVVWPPAPPAPVPGSRLTEAEKRGHRMFYNGAGMVYFEAHEYERSARFFQAALDLNGDKSDTPYLANVVQAWSRAGKQREALAALEGHSVLLGARPDLRAEQALLLGETGQADRALTNYAKLFADGFRNEAHFKEYAGLLSQSGQTERALAEVEKYLQARESADIRVLQAGLLKQQKKFDQAIALLQAQRQKNPFHAGLSRSLADAFLQAQRPSEALALTEELLKGQADDVSFLFLKGRAEYGLKWYRQAKESFEAALKKAPNDPDIQSLLNYTSGLLGEGANSVIKEPIEPVAVPSALLEPPPAPPADYARDYGAYYARRLTAVSFKRGREHKTTDYLIVRALNTAGVSAFSTFQIGFDPAGEELFINRLEVRTPDGTLVSTGRVADFYVLDDRSGQQATSRKVLNTPLAGLQPGYTVELVVTRRELGRINEFPFLAHSFSRPFPMPESVFFFRGDTGAVRYAASPRLEPERLPEGLLWRVREPAILRWEPMQATPIDYLPTVWIGDNSINWISEATNYLGSIRDRLELPAAQRELARQITSRATNDGGKIAAITGYLQTNFTYKAIEFGRRARIPQTTADIVRNKYGDCKDHALLAQQMLASVGVPASLALVSFNSALRTDLPSLDQFDHMIVHLPGRDGGRFLDCTDKTGGPSLAVPLGLAGREVFLLDEGRSRFVRIPDYPADASIIRSTRTVQLTNQTDALVKETLTLDGAHGAWLRDALRQQTAASQRSYLAGLLKGRGADLLKLEVENLEQSQAPLILNLNYALRSQFQIAGRELVGRPPACFEQIYLATEAVEKRLSPFQVTIPLVMESAVSIQAPNGFRARPATAAVPQWDGRFARGQVDMSAGKNGWQITGRLQQPAGRFAAGDYAAFCAALDHVSGDFSPRLTFERIAP